jgi:CRISPR-associated protein Cst1
MALAETESPSGVSAETLDAVVDKVVDDVVRAACASSGTAAYDWWKVLFALFPNSKPTHSKRSRVPGELRPEVAALFAADQLQAVALWPCVFCGAPSSVVWAKSMLPLMDTTKFVNTLPASSAGWPVCRGCRVAVWAMPYGGHVTAGSVTVLTCDDDSVEREFVARNVERAARIRQFGFAGLAADASPQAVVVSMLLQHSSGKPAGTMLWSLKNDNQEPWLRVTGTRLSTAAFLRRLGADSGASTGWRALTRFLTVREPKTGEVTRHGEDVVARALFDEDGTPHRDSLLWLLLRPLDHLATASLSDVRSWHSLVDLYAKEMHGMEASTLKPAADLLVGWITARPNPRGRFNEYYRHAVKPYELQKVLNLASGRQLLDGKSPPDITGVAPLLLASSQDGWRWRALLLYQVIARLTAQGVPIGQKSADDDVDENVQPEYDQADETEEAYA